MIIRFLDSKGRCCQVTTPETPTLIFFNKNERKALLSMNPNDCMISIDKNIPFEEQEDIRKRLNMKEEPLQIKP
jgi:hypothetical protein